MGLFNWLDTLLRNIGGGPMNPLETQIAEKYVVSGWRHSDSGNSLLAEVDFNTAVGMQPENYKIRVDYGQAMLKLNRLDIANFQLAKAIKLQPSLPLAWFIMAQVFSIKALQLDNVADARKAMDESSEIIEKVKYLNEFSLPPDRVPEAQLQQVISAISERRKRLSEKWPSL